MPLPVNTALLAAAAILVSLPYDATRVIVYVLVALAVANEALRFVATRPSGAQVGDGSYIIPAQPRAPDATPPRQRTPIRYEDGE